MESFVICQTEPFISVLFVFRAFIGVENKGDNNCGA